jgi:WD40 repeat protein
MRPTVLILAACACSGAKPERKHDAEPHAHGAVRAAVTAPASETASATVGEVDTPAGATHHDIASLPAPDASAAHDDLPAGATCRIGSTLLAGSSDLAFYGDRIYSAGLDNWRVFDAATGRQTETFELPIVSHELSPAGTCVSVALEGEQVGLYRMPERKLAGKRANSDDYHYIVPSDDCSVAMQSQGGDTHCVSLFGPGLEPTGEVCAGTDLEAVALSGNGTRLAMSTVQHGVHVFDTATRQEVATLPTTAYYAGTVALSRAGDIAAFVDKDRIRIVRLPSGEPISEYTFPKGDSVWSMKFSPAAKRLAIHLRQAPSLVVIDVATAHPLFTQRGLAELGAITFSPDGARIAYVAQGTIRVVDTFTGEETTGRGRFLRIQDAALSPAGDRAVISSAGHLTIWNTADCSRVADLPNEPVVEDLLVLPDGTAAIARAAYQAVRIDLGTGARTTVELGPANAIDSHALSPDGKLAVFGREDDKHKQQLVFIDVKTMKIIRRVTIPKIGPLGVIVFTTDGKELHVAGPAGLANGDSPMGDTSVVRVDAATGAIRGRFQVPGSAQSYTAAVIDHGRTIIVNDDWRVRTTGKAIPGDHPQQRAVSSDGATVVWNGKGGVFAWPADATMPAQPPPVLQDYGLVYAGRDALLTKNDHSCVVARTPR